RLSDHSNLLRTCVILSHGARKIDCPDHTITRVIGTQRSGVDIPLVTPTFESAVPGIFIAGEHGGMGLIRNALEQGRQVVDSIAQKHRPGGSGSEQLDVLIVGAGPAGFSASLTAKSKNMRYVTIE